MQLSAVPRLPSVDQYSHPNHEYRTSSADSRERTASTISRAQTVSTIPCCPRKLQRLRATGRVSAESTSFNGSIELNQHSGAPNPELNVPSLVAGEVEPGEGLSEPTASGTFLPFKAFL